MMNLGPEVGETVFLDSSLLLTMVCPVHLDLHGVFYPADVETEFLSICFHILLCNIL